jgi:separase
MAEKELQSAKEILMDTSMNFSCIKCRLMLEATVDQHLGDLSRSNFDSTTADISVERLSHAENLYKLALDKLNLSVWKNCVSFPEKANAESMMLKKTVVKDAECGASNHSACFVATEQDPRKSARELPKVKTEAKTSRKKAPKPFLKEKIPENNSRLTRSRYRSTQNQSMSTSGESQVGPSGESQVGPLGYLKGHDVFDCPDLLCQGELLVETKSCTVAFGCEVKCISDMRCWQCLAMAVMESGLVNNFVHMKWEVVRRRLLLRLLTGIGMSNFYSVYPRANSHTQTLFVNWPLFYSYPIKQTCAMLIP